MAFTAQELENIANAAFDYHLKGPAIDQAIQDKPLLRAMRAKQKTFPGGKEDIRVNVKGTHTTSLEGYTHNDTVTFNNPSNIKQANYPWKELHAGIEVTLSELKKDGIHVVDSTTGANTSTSSGRDMTVITGLLQDKLQDMTEGWAESFNTMLWKDGTQDSKEVAGIQSLITTAPSTGTVGGIDRATNTWWRNIAELSITPSTSSQTLTKKLRGHVRQLRRYGGRPDLILAGSDFLEGIELEVHEKGTYTDSGFGNPVDIASPVARIQGVGTIMYDPTLDDLSLEDYCFFIDTRNICLYVMDGEDNKTHTPARPHDQYAIYRAMTWTGGLIAKQLNGCGVFSVV